MKSFKQFLMEKNEEKGKEINTQSKQAQKLKYVTDRHYNKLQARGQVKDEMSKWHSIMSNTANNKSAKPNSDDAKAVQSAKEVQSTFANQQNTSEGYKKKHAHLINHLMKHGLNGMTSDDKKSAKESNTMKHLNQIKNTSTTKNAAGTLAALGLGGALIGGIGDTARDVITNL